MARVAFHPAFRRDVAAQVDHLVAQGDIERIEGLLRDVSALKNLVTEFPEAGRELVRDGAESLRMMRLRRAPFIAWYRSAPDQDEVTFYRLFHSRQQTPKPGLP